MIPERSKAPLWSTAPKLAALDRDIQTLEARLASGPRAQFSRQELYVYEDAIGALKDQRQKLIAEMAE